MVAVDRWSLYRGASVSLKWPMDQNTVVSIDRWFSIQVVFRTGFTAHTAM